MCLFLCTEYILLHQNNSELVSNKVMIELVSGSIPILLDEASASPIKAHVHFSKLAATEQFIDSLL